MAEREAEIAGKLTEAQKRAVLKMDERYRLLREIGASGNTMWALNDFGRCYDTTEQAVAPAVVLATWDVTDGAEGYRRRGAAVAGIASVKKLIATAGIVEVLPMRETGRG